MPYEIPEEWLKAAGMENFKRSRTSYRCEHPDARIIPLADIERPMRDAGETLDANGFKHVKMSKVLAAIRNDDDLPPIKLFEGGPPFRVYDGLHRFYVSLTFGFLHIPVVTVGSD